MTQKISFESFSDEEQSIDDEDYTYTNSNKETDIPSTTDFQPESFNQYSNFPHQQNKQETNNNNPENQTEIHDYNNFINPRRHTYDIQFPPSTTKRLDFSSVKRI